MSDQQWRILELLAQGMPNKMIARQLGLAPSTVKNQLTSVFGALGVTNRTQAAMAARAIAHRGAGAAQLAST
jgi:DNA-binding NarL/FixJ family response regulator